MTEPWGERRYHRPDARHTAGLTHDDIAPTPADDAELKRHCRAQNVPWETAYNAGLESRPNPYPDDEQLSLTWRDGRWERNRRRQDAVWGFIVARVRRRKPRRRR